jgi:hypothetical protein
MTIVLVAIAFILGLAVGVILQSRRGPDYDNDQHD